MSFFRPAPRSAQTGIPCKRCGTPLTARRSCRQAFLHCEKCKKDSELREYVAEMDGALEEFLEAVNCDRI